MNLKYFIYTFYPIFFITKDSLKILNIFLFAYNFNFFWNLFKIYFYSKLFSFIENHVLKLEYGKNRLLNDINVKNLKDKKKVKAILDSY